MRPPIFIFDGNDLIFCETVAKAEKEIEVYDVDEYDIFDVEGERLIARVVRDNNNLSWISGLLRLSDGRVELTSDQNACRDPQELHARIVSYLAAFGISKAESSSKSIDALVETLERLRR